ncbi:hypothetical protein AB0M02_21090 [Actinoplanes sp. NPDC051861]|uniref:hypothetical protein n=1 Tax=Actinoplanes sp. NPDC051861 TaxID=3155170 RepID=UPI00342497AF
MAATLIAAVLSIVVSSAGVIIAVMALSRSDDAVVAAEKAANAPAPTAISTDSTTPAAPETDPTADPGPAETGGGDPTPTDISPTAQFGVAYDGQNLRVRSVRCDYSNQTLVDLDEPRVKRTEEYTEIGYSGCEPGAIHTGLPFAEVSGPQATPTDCLEKIRTDPGRSPIAPARGMTICVQTSQNDAAAQSITQKLVFVTVDSLTRDNDTGVLTISVKAYKVPQ